MGPHGSVWGDIQTGRTLWLMIIFKPLLIPKRAITIKFESYFGMFVTEKVSMICNVIIVLRYCNRYANWYVKTASRLFAYDLSWLLSDCAFQA